MIVTVIQLIADVIVMALGNWVAIPYWIVLIFEVVLVAAYLISLIARKSYKSAIVVIDSNENNELYIRNLRIEIESMLWAVGDEELKKEMQKLYETVRYTTPISKPNVYDLEEEISDKVASIKLYISNGEYRKAKKSISDAINLIKERKARLAN